MNASAHTAPRETRGRLLERFGLLLCLLLLVLVLSLVTDRFLTVDNLTNVVRQSSINAIIAVGVMLVILTRGIDLSVGSVLAFSSVFGTTWLTQGGVPVPVAILLSVGAGVVLGLTSGALVAYLRIPPFIATLGMMTFARGAALAYTQGQPVSGLAGGYRWAGAGELLGVPVPIVLLALVYLLGYLLLEHTGPGRSIRAIGDNPEAARWSGLPVRRVQLLVYGISGGLAALAGVILAGRLNSAQPTAGVFYELDAIAAVVVGGTSFAGGKGSLSGTLIGALLIASINNGMNLLNFPADLQAIAKGAVIILALLLYRQLRRTRPGRAVRAPTPNENPEPHPS